MERIGVALRKTSLALKELAEAFESAQESGLGVAVSKATSTAIVVAAAPTSELAGKKRRVKKEKDPDEPKRPPSGVSCTAWRLQG